ncbi:DUF2570 family protein [Gallibacterium anatis]|uniref:DUF2570 family protein n=1 Tax=Gallibacterium anatis TaxID=750 RepID=UPI0039FD344B
MTLLLVSVIYQHQHIKSLKVEMAKQSNTIAMQSSTIERLKADALISQRLALELSKQESEARSQSDEIIKNISTVEKNSDCYRHNAPQSVIEFLQQ